MKEYIIGEDGIKRPVYGETLETVQTPISAEKALAEFLLVVKEQIDEQDHILKGEEFDKDTNKWIARMKKEWIDGKLHESVAGKIMDDDARGLYIFNLADYCSRIHFMSYYEEYNDIQDICREAFIVLGMFLIKQHYLEKLHCDLSYLRVMIYRNTRMIQACLFYALKGGMRMSMRESMKTIETVRRGEPAAQEKRKRFGIF